MKARQYAKKFAQRIIAGAKDFLEAAKYQNIAENYNLCGYKRVYFVHIRKAGGTSLNHMFLSLSGEDSEMLYSRLSNTPGHRLICNGLIYVGWNIRHINKGSYFYAFSHTPLHRLSLPIRTFTVSCFRDPIKRVISHYNMLMDFRINNIDHPCMAIEGKWLGDGFADFLQNIPKEHLLNQLYMFSKDFIIDEAVCNVRQLSHYFFSDEYDKGITELNRKTGLNLAPIHIRKASYQVQISEHDMTRLREMLDQEYKFVNRIRCAESA